MDTLLEPWPWYVVGAIIGLTVPALLLLGNKPLGISSSLRHICAACVPANIPFFKYDWRREAWNLYFVAGVLFGGFIAARFLSTGAPIEIASSTQADLAALGVADFTGLMPGDIFTTANIVAPRGLIFFVLGGLLVGFGTRWAGGCTSGHTIMGVSSLQWASVVASAAFMAGGFAATWLLLPVIFSLI
jgi:uncharacterized protein